MAVLNDTLREPPEWVKFRVEKMKREGQGLQLDFLLGVVDGVGSVTDVAANSESIVATNCA